MARYPNGRIVVSLTAHGLFFAREEVDILKRLTPVKSGRLRRGWHLSSSRKQIVNEVAYSEFVEYGTKYMKGRHYTQRSMKAVMDSVVRRHLLTTPEGQELLDAITFQVQRGGSYRAVFRNTVKPKFYKHLLRTVTAGVRAAAAARSTAEAGARR